MVLEGWEQGSSFWSTWAHWKGAAGRGAEARKQREDKLQQTETLGNFPCC